MKKTFIRSIRFSDEMMEIINQQVRENFNQKFERLIYNCYMLAGEKEKEIQRLDEQIIMKRRKLENLQEDVSKLRFLVPKISSQLADVYAYLDEVT